MKLVIKQEMDLIEFETTMYLPARAVWYRYTPLQREFIYYSLCEKFKGYSYSDIMEYITCELLGDYEILPQFEYGYVSLRREEHEEKNRRRL